MIPYGRQEILQSDLDAVRAVLESDFLTQGPVVPAFETAIARHVGAKHALATSSATSALHLACLALGLEAGDRLWTSPITFVASANCGLYCGAEVDFVDIDPRTYNICPVALESKLIAARANDKLPKIVIAVHLSGQPCDMEAIHALSQQYGFAIVEDASHAIGGKYKGKFIGDCSFSDVAVFSFHPVKIITTGEGGMVLTNNIEIAQKVELLRTHGISRDPRQMILPSDGPWYYQQLVLGYNYRMTDIQAALGLSQLRRLDQYVARRHEIAARYDRFLTDLPLVTPWRHPDTYSGMHLYIVRLNLDAISLSHREVFEELRKREIGVNLHYIPVHLQPFYRAMGFLPGDFPEAERYYEEAISLPMFPALDEGAQNLVIDALRAVLVR